MKTALEKRLGAPLDDKLCPAKEYLEKKLAEVEAGEYRAEALTEVVSKDEVDPDALLPVWDSKGNITVKRGASTVGEPQNAESLRRRLTLVRNCLMMIAVKHTNRPELQGDYLDVMEQYKDYILGEYVYGLHARDPEGSTIAVPPWTLVLAYEKAVRKQAMKLATTYGTPIPVALKEAWRDATVKERNFTTALALYSKRPMPFQGGDREHKYQKGEGPPKKGDGKGRRHPKGAVIGRLRGSRSAPIQHKRREMQSEEMQICPCMWGMPLWQAPDVCLHASDKTRCSRHPGYWVKEEADGPLRVRWKEEAELGAPLPADPSQEVRDHPANEGAGHSER